MDHAKMLNQLQTAAAESLQSRNVTLGDITIVSALLTEFAVTLLLFEEIEKFNDFNNQPNGTSACEKIEFDRALADVLKGVCCIEDAVVKKIRAGIAIDAAEDSTPVVGDCCSR
ncbi:hypothetical protein ABE021_09625 [Sporosarcina gallistercoris]|uniref:hypothetical protein n=1 Tax=Sporosarcina gallistercoris TaxID=2762245 RepID=UPI003D289441